jgi:Uma2 family endonuclease
LERERHRWYTAAKEGAMSTVLSQEYGKIHIPEGLTTLGAFLDWLDTTDLPEKLPIRFHKGEVWVDLMEEMFSHNMIKTALAITLGGIIADEDLGLYATDGMLLTNEEAELATVPDAMFLSNAALKAGRVRFTAGKKRDAVATRVVGTPDIAVEIVSPSSEDVDSEWLMAAYHNAGVPEYWVIDARDKAEVRFDIYRRKPKEYAAAPRRTGWVKSAVLDRSFRLVRTLGTSGTARFTLEVR